MRCVRQTTNGRMDGRTDGWTGVHLIVRMSKAALSRNVQVFSIYLVTKRWMPVTTSCKQATFLSCPTSSGKKIKVYMCLCVVLLLSPFCTASDNEEYKRRKKTSRNNATVHQNAFSHLFLFFCFIYFSFTLFLLFCFSGEHHEKHRVLSPGMRSCAVSAMPYVKSLACATERRCSRCLQCCRPLASSTHSWLLFS